MNNQHIKEGEAVAKKAISTLFALGVIKLTVGLFTGMTVIIADAMTTFADTLGVFASYFGLKLSRKSADTNFEYGYYKIETLSALIISIWIIFLGFLILKDSISLFYKQDAAQFRILAVVTTLIAMNHSYRLYRKLDKAGREANSLALQTSAKDKKMDVFSGLAVLISIAANYLSIPYIEAIVSITLALIVLKTGVQSAKEALFFLLDYWNDPKLKKRISRILRKEKDLILDVKHLKLRRAGTFIFGEAFVEINPFADLSDLREELKILQANIHELDPYIKDFAIYTHISKVEKMTIALPLKSGRSLNGVVADTLSQTQGYLFAKIRKGKIADSNYKKLKESDKKTMKLSQFFTENDCDILINSKINSLTYYHLRRTHQILIYPNFSDIKNARKTIELLLIDT